MKKENSNKDNVKNKKKKHKFLKFILVVGICIFAYNKFSNWCGDKAEEKFRQVPSYPIVSFNDDTNSKGYVTDDFIINDYSELGLEWTVDSNYVSLENNNDGTITVHVEQPENESEYLKLTLNSKFGNSEAKRVTEMMLVCKNQQTPEDFPVITKEMVESGEYKKPMSICSDTYGNTVSMVGDFNGIKINSKEDGSAFIEAYREALDLPASFSFKFMCSSFNAGDWFYSYLGFYNGIPIAGTNIDLFMDSNNELTYVSCRFPRVEITDEDLQFFVDTDDCLDDYIKRELHSGYYSSEKINTYIDVDYKRGASIYQHYKVTTADGRYDAYVDGKTGEVELESQFTSYASLDNEYETEKITKKKISEINLEECEVAECTGVNESGNKLEFVASKTKDGKYILYNRENNIICSKNEYNFPGYKFWSNINENSGAAFNTFRVEKKIDNKISEYSDKNFPADMAEEVQVFNNVNNAANWYYEKFGLNSYDDKNTQLIITANMQHKYDNAYWDNELNELYSCKAIEYDTCVSIHPVICAHEYTHAFANEALGQKDTEHEEKDNVEFAAVNEAYADIMAYMAMGGENWNPPVFYLTGESNDEERKEMLKELKGLSFVNRNPTDLNDKNTYDILVKNKDAITKYSSDINWKEDYHEAGNLIVNTVWNMYNDASFDKESLENVFYKYGEDINRDDTFSSFRQKVIEIMKKQKYPTELIKKAESYFDQNGIYSLETVTENIEEATTEDILLDDYYDSSFVAFISPIGTSIGIMPIYIFENGKNSSEEEIEEANKRIQEILEEKISTAYGADISGRIKIKYIQVSKNIFNIINEIVPDKSMDDLIKEASNGEFYDYEKAINFLISILHQYIITGFHYDGTAYDFYNKFYDVIKELYIID